MSASLVKVVDMRLTPNPALLHDPLDIEVDFTCQESLPGVKWVLEYQIDTAYAAIDKKQYESEVLTYEVGSHTHAFKVPSLNTGDTPEHVLVNVSTLTLKLVFATEKPTAAPEETDASVAAAEPLAKLMCVTQITKPTFTSPLHRAIFSPF